MFFDNNHRKDYLRIHYNPKLKQLARKLRKSGTLAEVLLWNQLKGRQVKEYKFTRQKPISQYIVDFCCNRLRLVIEIDGITHNDKEQADRIRQMEIEKMGLRFLRFYDSDIRNNLNGVLISLIDRIDKVEVQEGESPLTPPCCPPFLGGTHLSGKDSYDR